MSRVPIPPGDKEFEFKEQLYALFYELTSEIKGKDIELEEESYINSINSIQFSQLIDYLRDTIHILINHTNNSNRPLSQHIPIDNSECLEYAKIINHLEVSERLLIKKHFELMSIKEILEIRLLEFMRMDKEFRELKNKVKYEEGRFLMNERKDNEIIIIRAENAILKKTVAELEEKSERQEGENKEKNIVINQLNKSNKTQSNEVEKMKKDMKMWSNINFNVNNLGNNNNNSTKCSLCGGRFNNNSNNRSGQSLERSSSERSQFELFNMKKIFTQKVNTKIHYNQNMMNKSTSNKHLIDLTSNSKLNQYPPNNRSSMNKNMMLNMTQRDNLLSHNWNMNKVSPYCMKIPPNSLGQGSVSGNRPSSKRNLSSRISLSKKPAEVLYNNQYNNNANKSNFASPNFIGKR